VPQQQPSGERTVIRLDDPEPAEDQEAEPGYFLYEVKKGDTLSEIALQHLGTFKRTREIMDLNNINDPRSIKPGMKLKIPKQ
jgi:nucleoid-associated protein YgaU